MGQKPDATLLDSDGRVRSDERWQHFSTVLQKAAQCGLIVDVTFNREMLDAVSKLTLTLQDRGDPGTYSVRGS